MGLISTNLAPYDQGIITSLSTEIVQTMRRAAACLDPDPSLDLSHPWNYLCYYWFGITNPQIIINVKKTLYRMASIINLHPIYVSKLLPCFYKPTSIARTLMPLSGWRDNTENIITGAIDAGAFITRSENEIFNIMLGPRWHFTPQRTRCTKCHFLEYARYLQATPDGGRLFAGYRLPHCNGLHESKFQIIVHEITHLLLATYDHKYGYLASRKLAQNCDIEAWENADNWGYFLEEFRLHKLMAH
jgi:hypothetical protein